MKKELFFISGLPRSASTLLANLCLQNPKFHATNTSGLVNLLFLVRNQWHKITEHQAHPDNEALVNVLKGITNSYYQHINQDVIFDKNRAWLGYIPFIENILGKKAKILVCLRSIPDILASIERVNSLTSKLRQPPGEEEHFMMMQTLAGRCEVWMNINSFLGLAYARVVDAINSEYRDRLHFVHFDNLTSNPKETMKGIYEFLEKDYFEHNFDHIEQITKEDDAVYGFENLHKVKEKIQYTPSYARKVLGDELYFKYKHYDINI